MSEQAAEATGKMEEEQYLRMWFESVDEDNSGSINSLELQVFAFLLSTSSFFSSSFYSVWAFYSWGIGFGVLCLLKDTEAEKKLNDAPEIYGFRSSVIL